MKVAENSGPNSFPENGTTTLATVDLSTSGVAAYLATATFSVFILSGSMSCILSTYGSANADNDDTSLSATNNKGAQRLALQVPVVAPSGGTYGATLKCTTASASGSHEFVTLSAIQTAELTLG